MEFTFKKGFASDNNAPVHPQVMEAILNVNNGHAIAYGDDPVTQTAVQAFKSLFGAHIEIFFVYNGTGANTVGLQSMMRSFHGIICPDTAHIHVDECGAPEKFSGAKVLPVATPDGKLTIDLIKTQMHGIGFEHHTQPKVISITQVSEVGTIYTPKEIKAICDFAHAHNMFVHMDGARLANAVASLKCTVREITTDVGIDVLSLGGTKNGMMFGEALIFFNKELAQDTRYFRKQATQLHSKMRYISAQFLAMLENDLWLQNARHANKMAHLLAKEIGKIKGVTITQMVEANGVFAMLPPECIAPLQHQFFFYMWDHQRSEVRWMTSYDTTEEEIHLFVRNVKTIMEEYCQKHAH